MNTKDAPASANRILSGSLKLFGGIDLLAMIAVLMPTEWMRIGHRLCGLGEFPDDPLTEYLARSTSLLWWLHGVLLVYLSLDVARHKDVIRLVAWVTVIAGVGWLMIDLALQMPGWWTAVEGPIFAASGLWILFWLRRSNSVNQPS